MHQPAFLNSLPFATTNMSESWVWQVIVLVVVIIAINIGAYYLLRHIEKLASRSSSFWDDAFITAARQPVSLLLWTLGMSIALRIIHLHVGIAYFDLVTPGRNMLIVIALAWFFMRLIRNAASNIIKLHEGGHDVVDRTTVEALSKLGRITVIAVAILTILQTLGVSIAGVLAFGGIGGIAVGFAAKDLFANLLGGLTIYLDRPFTVGEWIRSPDKNIEGTVENIGWRTTRIRAFNKNAIYVPNAVFTNIVVENPSRMTHRRIKETIGLRYQDIDKIGAIVAEVKAMLHNHPDIDNHATLVVSFNQFSDCSLDFFIYAFTQTIDWAAYHSVKQDILLKIADIIATNKAEIAFPTRTLHIENKLTETENRPPNW